MMYDFLDFWVLAIVFAVFVVIYMSYKDDKEKNNDDDYFEN